MQHTSFADANPARENILTRLRCAKYFVEPHIQSFAEFRCWKGKRVLEEPMGWL